MARIRTIKPEFPQSQSMGRVSREARLLFILLWTVVDDSGRTRGSSRLLASLLYPYDSDAPIEIDRWIDELEQEGCVVRYRIDGNDYMQVCNWLSHQKIDKPSQSKFPEFVESSRILANPREHSSLDLDLDQDQGGDLDQGPICSTEAVPPVERSLNANDASGGDGCHKEPRPASSPEYPADFLRFWDAYPRVRRQNKGDALNAWKIAKRLAPAEVIIHAAGEYAQSNQGSGQFSILPARWLRARAWEDDRETWNRKDDRNGNGNGRSNQPIIRGVREGDAIADSL